MSESALQIIARGPRAAAEAAAEAAARAAQESRLRKMLNEVA